MPRVTFIGGFKDGEVSDMPSLDAQKEFKEIVRTPLDYHTANMDDPVRIYAKYNTDLYILQHIVCYEEKFWFYVEKSIGPVRWMRILIENYNPSREEG